MKAIRGILRQFAANEDGPTATEYAVLCALLIGFALVAIKALGGGVEGKWRQKAQEIMSSIGS
jgi:Flp pilus assembly pilin Flp